MNKIFSIAFIALTFASCQNSTDDSADSVSADSVTMSTTSTSADSGSLSSMANSPLVSGAAVPAQGGGNAAGANPEHGKPGHRCDIPVGAPLNSPPGQQAAPISPLNGAAPGMQAPAPVMTQAPAPAPAGGAGQRLNPAHGAPGHDCAVPVGQPLKG